MIGFCENPDVQSVVEDYGPKTSLYNWFVQYDLACVSKARVGFLGSALFIGWTLSAFVIPRLADLYGRRVIFMFAIVIQTIAFTGLFFA
jgi:MFS family permease